MPRIENAETRRILAQADGGTAHEKGLALEEATVFVFDHLPGAELKMTREKDRSNTREIDLAYRLKDVTLLPSFRDKLVIECKNLQQPVGVEAVAWFGEKLKHFNQSAGVLVASNGITGMSGSLAGAEAVLDELKSSSEVAIVVITRPELEWIEHSDELVELIVTKTYWMELNGKVWNGDLETLRGDRELAQVEAEKTKKAPFEQMRTGYSGLVESFVVPSHFWDLLRPTSTLLIGARGTGRTTLLRMTLPDSLSSWVGPEADRAREAAAVTSFFVFPPVSSISSDPELETLLLKAETVRGLVRAVREYLTRVNAGPTLDGKIAEQLSELLGVPTQPDLPALEECAVRRIFDLGRNVRSGNDKMLGTLGATLDYATWLVNRTLEGHAQVWAPIYDGLESFGWPAAAQVIEAMGHGAPGFVVKASSTSVIDPRAINPVNGPVAGSDFELIDLDGQLLSYSACRAIAETELARQGVSGSLEDVLGGGSEGVELENFRTRTMRALAEKDSSFERWLTESGLDHDPDRRAMLLRKVFKIVELRESVLKANGRRGRISRVPYTGAESLIQLSEGRPRQLLMLLTGYLEFLTDGRVSRQDQAGVIRECATLRFQQMLLNPEPAARQIVQQIGRSLSDAIYGEEFKPDPPLAVIVDKHVADPIRSGVYAALASGDLVRLPSGDPYRPRRARPVLESVRLDYLLATEFGLPLLRGRPTRVFESLTDSSDEVQKEKLFEENSAPSHRRMTNERLDPS